MAAGILTYTDPAGNLTQVIFQAGNGGNPGEVRRTSGSNVESWLYSYHLPGRRNTNRH